MFRSEEVFSLSSSVKLGDTPDSSVEITVVLMLSTVIMHPVHAVGPCTRSPPPVQHKIEAVALHTVAIIIQFFGGVLYRSMRQYSLIQNVQAELRCGRGGWLL